MFLHLPRGNEAADTLGASPPVNQFLDSRHWFTLPHNFPCQHRLASTLRSHRAHFFKRKSNMRKVRGKGPPADLTVPLPTSPKCRAISPVLSNVIRRADMGRSRGLLFVAFPAINWVTLIKSCRLGIQSRRLKSPRAQFKRSRLGPDWRGLTEELLVDV